MKLAAQLSEALSKNDAKSSAKELGSFLAKGKFEKGSKEEEAAIEKWFKAKKFDDKDSDNILKFL